MKKTKVATISTVAVFIAILLAIKVFPVELMHAWEGVNRTFGRTDYADDIKLKAMKLEVETKVSRYFDDKDIVWVELPRSYSGVAGSKYMDMFPVGHVSTFITTPDAKFILCVPRVLESSFTIEALEEYKAQQAVVE